jgi:hypothetical protein
MKAQKLIHSAVLQPDQLNLDFGGVRCSVERDQRPLRQPMSIEAGRLRLANAVLAAYRDGMTDADALKAVGLAAMRRP